MVLAQPRATGLVLQLFRVLAEARGRGIDCHVFCLVRTPEEADSMATAARKFGLRCECLEDRGALDFRPLRAFIRRMREQSPLLIQTHGYKPSLYGLLARVLAGRPWVAFYHGRTFTDWKVKLYHALDRWLMSCASAIVTAAPGVDRHFHPWDRGRLVVVPNGLVPIAPPSRSRAESRVAWNVGEGARAIGYVGRLSREKGPDRFLAALARLRDEGMPVHGLVVGEGPLRPRLEKLAGELAIEDDVTFTGYVPNVADAYAAMDVLVISSRSEVFPNVLLEAVDAGLPVAATPVGGIPSVARVLGTVVTSDDGGAGALAAAVKKALGGATADALARARTRLHERYSQGARAEKLMDVYAGVASHPRAMRHQARG